MAPANAGKSRTAPRTSTRQVSDRPSVWRLLLLRQRHFAKWIGLGFLGLFALIFISSMYHAVQPSQSLDTVQERWGRLIGVKVKDIQVEGLANTPEPLLRAALGVSKGDDLFGFSVGQARQRIEKLPWVQSVSVERRLPGLIIVHVQEKRPFAIWQHDDQFKLIDREGAIVKEENLANFGTLPLVVGANAPDHAAAMLDLLAKYPVVQSRTAALVRVGDQRWDIHLKTNAVVKLPQGHEAAALQRLVDLQSKDLLLDRPMAVIDMRLPDRLVLEPAADSHADESQKTNPKKATANPATDSE